MMRSNTVGWCRRDEEVESKRWSTDELHKVLFKSIVERRRLPPTPHPTKEKEEGSWVISGRHQAPKNLSVRLSCHPSSSFFLFCCLFGFHKTVTKRDAWRVSKWVQVIQYELSDVSSQFISRSMLQYYFFLSLKLCLYSGFHFIDPVLPLYKF